tara:strand:- start:801 stop:959 length:159 start_codon:yes stop_codon:yes gene_type:complete
VTAAELRKTRPYRALPRATKDVFNNIYGGLKYAGYSEEKAVATAVQALKARG